MVLIGTAPAVWFQSFTILVLHLDFWVTLLSESKCPLCSKTKSVVTCTADHHMHRIWGPTAERLCYIFYLVTCPTLILSTNCRLYSL